MQVYVMVSWSHGQVRAIIFQIHVHGTGSRMCGGEGKHESQRDVQGGSEVWAGAQETRV